MEFSKNVLLRTGHAGSGMLKAKEKLQEQKEG